MQKPWIPFFLFALLCTLVLPFPGTATAVIPGWHTTILTPYFIIQVIVMIILLLVTIGYWKLAKRTGKINRSFFTTHIILTLPAVLITRAPGLLLLFEQADTETPGQQLMYTTIVMITAFALFTIGQLLFAVYFFRTILSH